MDEKSNVSERFAAIRKAKNDFIHDVEYAESGFINVRNQCSELENLEYVKLKRFILDAIRGYDGTQGDPLDFLTKPKERR